MARNKKDAIQIEEAETFVSLGHELSHQRVRQKVGTEKYEPWSNERIEAQAMFEENHIGFEHRFRQRTYYGIIQTDYGGGSVYSVDFKSIPALTLPLPSLPNFKDQVLCF